MKSFKAFAIALVAAFVFVACSNVEKILPKNDGTWDVTEMSQRTYVDGSLTDDTTYTNAGTVTFDSDGTGTMTDSDTTTTFEWSVNSDNDQVTITQDDGQGGKIAFVYDVLESKKNEQEWSGFLEMDLGGTKFRFETDMTLERQ